MWSQSDQPAATIVEIYLMSLSPNPVSSADREILDPQDRMDIREIQWETDVLVIFHIIIFPFFFSSRSMCCFTGTKRSPGHKRRKGACKNNQFEEPHLVCAASSTATLHSRGGARGLTCVLIRRATRADRVPRWTRVQGARQHWGGSRASKESPDYQG